MPFRHTHCFYHQAVAVFASVSLPGRSLARSLVAEAEYLRPSASVERSGWLIKNTYFAPLLASASCRVVAESEA